MIIIKRNFLGKNIKIKYFKLMHSIKYSIVMGLIWKILLIRDKIGRKLKVDDLLLVWKGIEIIFCQM